MEAKNKSEKNKDQASQRNIKEVKLSKVKKKRYILLYIAIFGFALYAVITLVNQFIEISDKKQQLEDLQSQIVVQEIKNDQIKEVKNYSDKELAQYIEQIAREDLDYIKEGERVFVNIAGE
ncbi:MAG: septum formation initiator family protein [Ruminococcus sp.]|nr:septum formation initiator family protein [Ruminococcus sp.]